MRRLLLLFPLLSLCSTAWSATLTLQKGVYTLIVEANLHYTDGTVQYVRNADHNTPSEALAWMDDRSSIVLLLKYVN